MKLPGLIAVHVHMREPGGAHKEDWDNHIISAMI
jgi:dihydroorotase-like cyclic amidohydrolase